MAHLIDSPAWKALHAHYATVSQLHMRDLFAQDPERFRTFSTQFQDILLDYSKNRITAEDLSPAPGPGRIGGCARLDGENVHRPED